jgi:predicted ArsR family transcriptional regulator
VIAKPETWTFVSNHAHVHICLTHDPQPTARQIAHQAGITERAVQRILSRLITAGVASVTEKGRRNYYQIDLDQRLRHPLEAHQTIGEFIKLIDNEYQTDD